MDPGTLERSIAAYQDRLAVTPREASPLEWATLHMSLGNAYQSLATGDPEDNLERAIREYESALEVFSRRNQPEAWASILANMAICLQSRRRGDPGEDLERVIDAYTQYRRVVTRKVDPEQWADVTVNLGVAYLERWYGNPAENVERGIRYLRMALRVFTRQQFPYDWATTLSSLGAGWANRIRGRQATNLERALVCFHQALGVLDARTGPYDRATVLVNLGAAYRARARGNRADNLERALQAYSQAMRLRPREVDPERWAFTRLNLSLVYQQRVEGRRAENMEQALAAASEALDILTAEGNSFGRARALVGMSEILQDRIRGDREENFERAVALSMEALEIVSREGGEPRLQEAALASLGTAFLARPRGDRSENLERAINIFEQLLEARTRETRAYDWARTMTNLAIAYRDLSRGDRAGNLERCIEILEQALEEQERCAPEADRATTLIHLTSAFQERLQGNRGENLERSIQFGLRAVALMWRRGNPVEMALALTFVGSSMTLRVHGNREENLEAAITAYRTALKILRRAPALERARVLSNLGIAWFQRQSGDRSENLEAALRHTRRALRLRPRADAPVEWAATMNNLGLIYSQRLLGRRTANVARALSAWRAALEVLSPDSLPHDCRMTAALMGDLLANRERWEEADVAYGLALRAAETLYRSSLASRGRDLEIAETGDLAWRSAFVQMRAGRLEEAVTTAERARARGLAESLLRDRADLGQVERERPELFAAYQEAVRTIQDLELGERSPAAGRGGVAPESAARRQEMGRAAWNRLERVVQEIRALQGFEAFLRDSGFHEIAEAVPAGSVLVYLSVVEFGAMTLCVFADPRGAPIRIFSWATESLTSGDLDHLLGMPDRRRVGEGYLRGQLISTEGLEHALGPVLARLGRDLIGPLADRLRGFEAASVVLVPGGKLSLLPLHAAPYTVEGRRVCLLDESDVSYAPAARVLAAARTAVDGRKELLPALGGLADPRPDPRPLRYPRFELNRIAGLFPSTSQIAMGEEATREAFLRIYGQVTHLHLACHGRFEGWDILGSHLLLAQDDKLELRDLMALRVSQPPRLVVLSACQTAVYEFQDTPDELIGLPAGFLRSGAPGVVACLWQVDDLSTALLMTRFYELHLRGGSRQLLAPAAALRQAQLWLRDVKAGDLLRLFREQRELARRGISVLEPTAIAAGESLFALEEPESRPYSALYHWAPFVFLGV